MTPSKPSNKSLILAAVEIESDAEREAFLRRACGEDDQLRAEIAALVDAHNNPPAVVKRIDNAQTAFAQPGISEGPSSVIGPYKLLEQIGEGGMGVVYMAEQTEPVRRRVALKIIKPGMDTRRVIARFEAERQALTMMDHPNIAKVLDAGTTGEKGVRNLLCEAPEGPSRQEVPDPFFAPGRPYFVMELV